MSIKDRWMNTDETSFPARNFLSTFDLDIHHLPSRKLHILDYPDGENGFNQLRKAFHLLATEENIPDAQITSAIEDEPAARLVFLFLADPKDLATKVSHLTTYTSSEHPIIWILVKEKYHPRTKEKIPSIWEPLTNAQYYEIRPTIKVANVKWIGTRFTIGRQGVSDPTQDRDIHMALTLSTQAQQRRSTTEIKSEKNQSSEMNNEARDFLMKLDYSFDTNPTIVFLNTPKDFLKIVENISRELVIDVARFETGDTFLVAFIQTPADITKTITRYAHRISEDGKLWFVSNQSSLLTNENHFLTLINSQFQCTTSLVQLKNDYYGKSFQLKDNISNIVNNEHYRTRKRQATGEDLNNDKRSSLRFTPNRETNSSPQKIPMTVSPLKKLGANMLIKKKP